MCPKTKGKRHNQIAIAYKNALISAVNFYIVYFKFVTFFVFATESCLTGIKAVSLKLEMKRRKLFPS